MKKIYIVEDYCSGDFVAFDSVDAARTHIIEVYLEHINKNYLNRYSPSIDGTVPVGEVIRLVNSFKGALDTILSNYPYIEDICYSSVADYHESGVKEE